MAIQELFIWWADESAAANYGVNDLSPPDAVRAAAVRGPKALSDWKVSRALLQAVRASIPAPGVSSLSHSHGHAICATAPAGWKVGADLERIRPRDVERLAQWVCSTAEREALAALDGAERLERFYLLWTLKEAFVKAAGLDFPADMARVGLDPAPDGPGLLLRAPPGGWGAAAFRVGHDWMACAVWQEPAAWPAGTARPGWRGAWSCEVPALMAAGHWRTDTD
ncbi:4'-phosphopantetheinyl transferase sfp [compost metagenome]|uniref:4'-phosphopantetheinyl transferase family protein n=1 Tax=Achromobacter sp. Root83 TaxID=1736602 RepID=UPI0007094206|nr:4'-phosphopantetheinyl transferase superfamily protein [Achromobacter sp. Root83]KRC70826.1 4-diphosphocytidyl-2C-methyl-D-erythritol kinase [Achromobacter sp. Root83]